jgi:hypothetical protein
MRSVASVLLRIVAVGAGAATAYLLAAPIDVPEVALAVAATVLAASGAIANRWWAAAVIPLGVVLWMFGAYANDPSWFLSSKELAWWVYVLWFLGASVVAGICVACGVAARRVLARSANVRAHSAFSPK